MTHPLSDQDELQQTLENLRAVYRHLDDQLRDHYNRSLPFQDALIDRWERAKELNFGEGASLYNSAVVFQPVSVGKGTWIGPNTILDGSGGGVTIGTTCSISAGVQIYTHDTVGWALSGGEMPARKSPVYIGDRTYIGSQSIIGPGVTLGKCCVVGANSYVNHDVADYTIVAGTPAKIIGRVEFDDNAPILIYKNGTRRPLSHF